MIRFFVSSTFQDMHKERDCIQRKISPYINDLAVKYHESILFADY